MGSFCGSKPQSVATNQAQTYSPNPFAAGAITGALNQVQNVSQTPFSTPQAPVAGFSPDQLQAFGLTNMAQGAAQPFINNAANYFSGANTNQFLNPYAGAVLGGLSDIFGQQMSQTTGNLTQAAGGVGADRIAVGQSELAKQQGLAAGQTLSGLYAPALQAAQTAGFGMANLGAENLNTQLQGAGALLGTGGLQQQLTQAQLNAPYQQQLAQIAWPFQTASFGAQNIAALAPGLGGTTTGQGATTYPGANPWGSILGGGMALAGAAGQAGLFNGFQNLGGGYNWDGSASGNQWAAAGQGQGPYAATASGGRVGYDDGGTVEGDAPDIRMLEERQLANETAQGAGTGPTSLQHASPIDIAPASLVPQSQITPIRPVMPNLNLNPPTGGSGNSGSGFGQAIGTAANVASKVLPLVLGLNRGGRANPYAPPRYDDGGNVPDAPELAPIERDPWHPLNYGQTLGRGVVPNMASLALGDPARDVSTPTGGYVGKTPSSDPRLLNAGIEGMGLASSFIPGEGTAPTLARLASRFMGTTSAEAADTSPEPTLSSAEKTASANLRTKRDTLIRRKSAAKPGSPAWSTANEQINDVDKQIAGIEGPNSPFGQRHSSWVKQQEADAAARREAGTREDAAKFAMGQRRAEATLPFAVSHPDWMEAIRKASPALSTGTGFALGLAGRGRLGKPLGIALPTGAAEGAIASSIAPAQDIEYLPHGPEWEQADRRVFSGDPELWHRIAAGSGQNAGMAGVGVIAGDLTGMAGRAAGRGISRAYNFLRGTPAAEGAGSAAAAARVRMTRTEVRGPNGETYLRYEHPNTGRVSWKIPGQNGWVSDPGIGGAPAGPPTVHTPPTEAAGGRVNGNPYSPYYGTDPVDYDAEGVPIYHDDQIPGQNVSPEAMDAWRRGVNEDVERGQTGTDMTALGFAPTNEPPVLPRANRPPTVAAAQPATAPSSPVAGNPYAPPPPTPDAQAGRGFADSPWAALMQAGLGAMAAAGQRDARGLPMSPMAAIGQGGMQGMKMLQDQRAAQQKQQQIEQSSRTLALNAQKMQYEMMKPITLQTMAGPISVVRRPDGNYEDIITGDVYGGGSVESGGMPQKVGANGQPIASPRTMMKAIQEGKVGPDFAETIPQPRRGSLEAVAFYEAPLTTFMSRSGMPRDQALGLIKLINPDYDETFYRGKSQGVKDFLAGGNTSPASNIMSYNTALGHAGDVSDAIEEMRQVPGLLDAIKNTNLPFVQGAIQLLQNKAVEGTPTGRALNRFKTAMDLYGAEVAKIYTGANPSQEERNTIRGPLDPKKSLEELEGSLSMSAHMMGSRGSALQERWKNALNAPGAVKYGHRELKDFPVVQQRGQAALDRINQRDAKNTQAGAQPPPEVTSQLKEGQNTHFQNGQVWTLQNGKPVRIK